MDKMQNFQEDINKNIITPLRKAILWNFLYVAVLILDVIIIHKFGLLVMFTSISLLIMMLIPMLLPCFTILKILGTLLKFIRVLIQEKFHFVEALTVTATEISDWQCVYPTYVKCVSWIPGIGGIVKRNYHKKYSNDVNHAIVKTYGTILLSFIMIIVEYFILQYFVLGYVLQVTAGFSKFQLYIYPFSTAFDAIFGTNINAMLGIH